MAYCGLHKQTFPDDEDCPFCIGDRQIDDDCGEFDEGESFEDCHMDRTGACGKAGSEECEFECPYRADQRERELRVPEGREKGI